MNYQFQVSNEKEDKSSSSSQEQEENALEILQSDYQNQHLQQWPNYFTSPSATLVPNTQCPSHKEEIKKVSLKRKPKRAKQDVMEVHGSRIVRATGKKDRHSKVSTANGTKDRRVRLSPNTAIQFYDVQDRLGYDRPSKAIDWLIKESQGAISALEKTPFQALSRKIHSTNAEKEEGQHAADMKTELEKLSPHSSKHNATMQYVADRFPEGSYKEQNSKVCPADAKIQSLSDSQIRNLRLFSSAHGSKIQSFCELQTYPQGHFHSETRKQSANEVKIQSFSELQTYPQGHFHSETKKQSASDAKIQSFSELHTYPQSHFHSETTKQSPNEVKIQSFSELQTYPQSHFHSETKRQSPNDVKIQSFCELQIYPQGHFHSETRNQLANFINFHSSHQNESISFSSDHHHQAFLTKTNLESRQDPSFSFSPQNFPTVLSQNQMFNFQREPLQSTSNFPQTISYSNNIGLSNDGLLGFCTTPIIQEEEEEEEDY